MGESYEIRFNLTASNKELLDDILGKLKQSGPAASEASKGFEGFADSVKNFVQSPLQAAGDMAKDFILKLGPMGSATVGAAGVFGLLGKTAFETASNMASLGTEIHNISLRTGFTTKEVGQFSFAAKIAGTDVGVFEMAMRRLSQGLAEGSTEGAKARDELARLGITAKEPKEVFTQVAEAMGHMSNAADRNALALNVFGRAGLELVPVMMSLNESLAQAKKLDLGMDEKTVKSLEEAHKQLTAIEAVWAALARKPKVALTIELSRLMKWMSGDETSDKGPMTPQEKDIERRRREYDNGPQSHIDSINASLRYAGGSDAESVAHRANLEHELAKWKDLASGSGGKILKSALNDGGSLDKQLEAAQKNLEAVEAEARGMGALVETEPARAMAARLAEAHKEVSTLEAKVEASKESIAASKKAIADLAALTKAAHASVDSRERQASEAQWGAFVAPVAQAADAHSDLMGNIAKVKDPKERAALEAREIAAYSALVIPLIRTAASKEAEAWAAIDKESDKSQHARITSILKNIYGVQAGSDWDALETSNKLDEITESSIRDKNHRASSHAFAMAQASGMGAGDAENAAYTIRLKLAQEMLDSTNLRIKNELVGGVALIAQAHAKEDYDKSVDEARFEREEKIAQLRASQVQSLQSGVFHGIMGGGAGMKQFATGLGTSTLEGVFTNATRSAFEKLVTDMGKLGKSSGMGKYLDGTPFDQANAKKPDPITTATDLNTSATRDNTAAIRSMRFGNSGGGAGTGGGWNPDSGGSFDFGTPPSTGLSGDDETNYANGLGGSPFGGFGDGKVTSTSAASMEAGGSSLPEYSPSGSSGGSGGSGEDSDMSAWGTNVGKGIAVAGGTMAAYSGFSKGGAKGDLTGVAGAAMAIAPFTGPAAPFIMAGAAGLQMISSLLGDPVAQRKKQLSDEAQAASFTMPTGAHYNVDSFGQQLDQGANGQPRVTVQINALDMKSLSDRKNEIAEIVRQGINTYAPLRRQIMAASNH